MRNTKPFTHLTVKTDYTGDIMCVISRYGQSVRKPDRTYYPGEKSLGRIEELLNKDPYLDVTLEGGIRLVSIFRKHAI